MGCRSYRTRGFTLIETSSALAVGAILLGMVARPATSLLDRKRVDSAAQVIAADLELARSAAQRQRKPVRISFNASTMTYSVTDRASGAVFRSRVAGSNGDLNLRTLNFTPSTVDVFPAGMTSSALTVSIGSGGSSRQVTMTRVGLVRR